MASDIQREFDDFEAHEREQRAVQVAMYRAMTDAERLAAALAFHREVLAMTPPVDLRGTAVDREREAAKLRIDEGMAPLS